MDEVIGQVSSSEYWEFMCGIEQMKSAQVARKLAELELVIHEQKIQIAELKRRHYKDMIKSTVSQFEEAEREYKKFKVGLESKYNISLDSCAIDPVTFEIKKLPESPK